MLSKVIIYKIKLLLIVILNYPLYRQNTFKTTLHYIIIEKT